MRIDRPRLVNYVALVVVSCAVGYFLEGAGFWIGAVLICAATAFGARALIGAEEPHGAALEALATPPAAAFATVGLVHGVGSPLAAGAVLAGGAVLVAAALEVEVRLMGPADETTAHVRQQLVLLAVLLCFLCFSAAAASVYEDLFAPGAPGAVPAEESRLALLVLADALIALVLGYRLAALRALSVRDAIREAGTFAVVIAVAAALIRAIALPRLLAPALLAAVFYVWNGYRSASRAERRSNAWLWEYLALAGAAALAIAWNLLLR